MPIPTLNRDELIERMARALAYDWCVKSHAPCAAPDYVERNWREHEHEAVVAVHTLEAYLGEVGLALVPRGPTDEMVTASFKGEGTGASYHEARRAAITAAIAASQPKGER